MLMFWGSLTKQTTMIVLLKTSNLAAVEAEPIVTLFPLQKRDLGHRLLIESRSCTCEVRVQFLGGTMAHAIAFLHSQGM